MVHYLVIDSFITHRMFASHNVNMLVCTNGLKPHRKSFSTHFCSSLPVSSYSNTSYSKHNYLAKGKFGIISTFWSIFVKFRNIILIHFANQPYSEANTVFKMVSVIINYLLKLLKLFYHSKLLRWFFCAGNDDLRGCPD